MQQKNKKTNGGALFQSPKRPGEYQGYRAPDRPVASNAMPILVGAAIIAVAILLSTLITAVGSRYLGIETPTDETVWLVDRLTGSVYKCQAPERQGLVRDRDGNRKRRGAGQALTGPVSARLLTAAKRAFPL